MDDLAQEQQQLRVPIIQLSGVFIVCIQVALDDSLVLKLKEDVARTLHRLGGRGLIIDLTGIDIVDSYISRTLYDIAAIARLMGVPTVLCSMAPHIAMTLAQMGLDMPGVLSARDLDCAHRMLGQMRQDDSISERCLAEALAAETGSASFGHEDPQGPATTGDRR